MSPSASYSFLPWLRLGIANTTNSADGDAAVKTRATIHLDLSLTGDPVSGNVQLIQDIARDVALYGPGDIVGIDPRAVIRTEPRDWVTNFESNYLAAVEFCDADLPWRYTPAAPDATALHLRPWIALVVLKESEFEDGQNSADHPLPCISVSDLSVFPAANELWAWAHIHFNQSLSADPSELVSPDLSVVLPRVQAAILANPDVAYSRLLCPRRLDDNTAYDAFVVPVFETGRLAGLGQKPDAAPHATFSAWALYPNRIETANFPVYFRWHFRTGSRGDFEYLVDLLEPRPLNARLGTRDLDVQDPGSNIPGITDPALGGILRLGGVLGVPDADLTPDQLADRQKYENWDQPYPHVFEKKLAAFVNLADDYAAKTAAAANAASGISPGVTADPDPLITAPLYGRWHALTSRLLTRRDGTPAPNTTNWVHRLNLDPRFRVAANLGAQVVEANAEAYMNAAWQQIGDVLAANQRIRRLQLASAVASRWYVNHLRPLASTNAERAFGLGSPVASRVLVAGSTVERAQQTSLLGATLTTAAARSVMRPNARLLSGLPFDPNVTPRNLLARVNARLVFAAPAKTVPAGVPTVNQASSAAASSIGAPGWLVSLLAHLPWLPLVVLVAAVLLALFLIAFLGPAGLILGIIVIVAGIYLYRVLRRFGAGVAAAYAIQEANQVPASVASLPRSPDFTLSAPGSSVRPTVGFRDNAIASRFKSGLRDSFSLLQASGMAGFRPAPGTLDLPSATTAVIAGLNPRVTIFNRGLSAITIPLRIGQLLADPFGDVMAYPRIDLPMYLPLKALGIELFLPGINLVVPNSITLLETNRRFVEAYMVGLNHEFARKLLWREYPTDQRGSYFRQFWDVRGYFDSENLDPQVLREKLYDIPELHRWTLDSALGAHDNRQPPGHQGESAVLVIRGELLKKYPTAVIYAQRAQWETKPDGTIDPDKPRRLVDLTPEEEASPPRTKVRTPLYDAKADPDIYFLGFDLTIAEALGQPGNNPGDDPGWFFVIKERPGEPRFGLELTRSGSLEVFDELIWADALPGEAPGQFLPATALSDVRLVPVPPPDPEGKQPQQDDDKQVNAAAASSARWAYLLFRQPVIVAVHAAQLLGAGGV